MASPNIGFGGSVGIAEESTWGTPANRTNWLYTYSTTLTRTISREALPILGMADGTHLGPRYTIDKEDLVEGAIEWPMAYNDSTVMLLKHALGSVATTGPASTKYTHTCDLPLPSAQPVGLTVEQIMGLRGSTINALVFSGVRCSRLVIAGEWGMPLRGTFEGIGKTHAGIATAGTPTYHSGEPAWILASHVGNLTWSSINDKIRSFRLTFDPKLVRRPNLGSAYTDQPWQTDAVATLEVTREFDETTYESDYTSATSSDLAMTFTGSGDNTFKIDMKGSKIMRRSLPISDRGVTLQTLTFQSFAATDLLQLTMTNSNSTATAN
jgi:hypothetical protein